MVCKVCEKGKIVMHGFSRGFCEKCKCDITTVHTPCDKLCDDCSEKYDICKECGEKINGDMLER